MEAEAHRPDLQRVLDQMEAATLLPEASEWKAKGAWLTQVLPVATSEFKANEDLYDMLHATAKSAGLEVPKSQVENVDVTPFYRQFSVTLSVSGDLPSLMRWIYERLQPGSFYVVPQLRITQDKDDTKKVNAQVRFMRWYAPDMPAPPIEGTPEAPATASSSQ